MSDFGTVTPLRRPVDPYKRVQYSQGLVLGVEEFDQEQAYLMERDRQHQRLLHGYGTVCGLALSTRTPVLGEPEIVVSAGAAVAPSGETIRVPAAQCAPLNDWLERHEEELRSFFGSPPSTVVLEVRLCARSCSTDAVPIPGGPCRSQQDAMKASRWADDFELSLVPIDPMASPPPALADTEEEIVRLLGQLLGRIVVDGAGPFTTGDQLADLVRTLDDEAQSPPGSPPSVPVQIQLDPLTAEEDLRRALLVWVTEVRPTSTDPARGCCAEGAARSGCVALGTLTLNLQPDLTVLEADIAIDETTRPFLLSTRVLQEWPAWQLLSGASPAPAVTLHSALTGLGADDHPHYLRADGARALTGDLALGGNRVTGLAAANAAGQAVRFEQAVKLSDAAGGDLGGLYPVPSVRALQGRPVTNAAPATNAALVFDGVSWAPNTGAYVGAAAGLARLIAAGHFTAAGSAVGLVYGNGLVLSRVGGPLSTEYVVTFSGYANPNTALPARMYILTGLVSASATDAPGHFQFANFAADGIHFRASGGGTATALAPNRTFLIQIIGYGGI